MPAKLVGAPIRRLEDPRLLRGLGTFVEDLVLPGMLRVAFVRSVYPHARLSSVNLDAARALPGVVGGFTAADFAGEMRRIDP